MSVDEYRARQMANEAQNQRTQSSLSAAKLGRHIHELQALLETAIALLDEGKNAEARDELQLVMKKLALLGH